FANADSSLSVNSSRANFATFSTSCFVISMSPHLSIPQDVQNHHPARPQTKTKPQAYPPGYVEDFVKSRTPLGMIFNILLLYRDALGQVPWLIHIRTPQHCDMICQELQWNCKQNRRDQWMRVGNRKHRISDLPQRPPP